MTYFYNLHNIIRLESAVDLGLHYFQCKESLKEVDLIVKIVGYRPVDKEKYQRIASGLYYSEDEDSIISNMNILGLKISWEIKNILSSTTELRVSKSYVILSKYILTFPISSVYKLVTWIRMAIQIKMLLKNYSYFVGGCAHLNGKNVIFTGTGGSGKTLTTINFVEAYGADFMSDDMLIVNKATLYSYPITLKIRKFNFDFISYSAYIDPVAKFSGKIRDEAKGACDIYFLESSASSFIRKISSAEGINKLCNLNNKALLYFNERIFSSLSYLHEEFSLENLQKKQRDILSSLFRDARFHIICASDSSKCIELLKDKYCKFS